MLYDIANHAAWLCLALLRPGLDAAGVTSRGSAMPSVNHPFEQSLSLLALLGVAFLPELLWRRGQTPTASGGAAESPIREPGPRTPCAKEVDVDVEAAMGFYANILPRGGPDIAARPRAMRLLSGSAPGSNLGSDVPRPTRQSTASPLLGQGLAAAALAHVAQFKQEQVLERARSLTEGRERSVEADVSRVEGAMARAVPPDSARISRLASCLRSPPASASSPRGDSGHRSRRASLPNTDSGPPQGRGRGLVFATSVMDSMSVSSEGTVDADESVRVVDNPLALVGSEGDVTSKGGDREGGEDGPELQMVGVLFHQIEQLVQSKAEVAAERERLARENVHLAELVEYLTATLQAIEQRGYLPITSAATAGDGRASGNTPELG